MLVDARGRKRGTADRVAVHRDGRLHRAVSVFIVNDASEILLQRRSRAKEVAPGLGSNACCTHPRPGERAVSAAKRRLYEELKIQCALKHSFSFMYRAEFNDGWVEHELDHVFVGRSEKAPTLLPSEADDWCWMGLADLQRDIRRRPQRYSPWLRIALPKVLRRLKRAA